MSLNIQENMIEVRYPAAGDDTYHDTIEEDLLSIGYTVIHSGEAWQTSGEYYVLVAQKDYKE